MATHWAEQLPAEYLQDEVFSALSIDAQIYYRCSRCTTEWRLNQALSLLTPPFYEGRECPDEDGGVLRVERHVVRQDAVCLDCRNSWPATTNGFETVRCPACGSRHYFPMSTRLSPPMPRRFRNVDRDRDHVWGVDPHADLTAIVEEREGRGLLFDAAQYLVPGILFCRRLATTNDYPDSDAWIVLNAEGTMLRQYYRETGEVTAGVSAVDVFEECAPLPAD